MALAIASLSSGSGNDLTTLTLTAPTGIQVGDLLLAVVHESRPNVSAISGFSTSFSQIYNGVTWADSAITVLYKVAESADTSASDYTVNFGTQYGGAAVMYRISGWGGNTTSPVFKNFGFIDSTAYATKTFSNAITCERQNDGFAFIVGARNIDDTFVGSPNHSAYAITSTDGNLTWTEDIEVRYTDADNNFSLFSVASAPSTATSDITNFEYYYDRQSSLTSTTGVQSSVFFFIAEPQDATGNNTFVEFEPEFFTNATSLGATGAAAFVEVEPVVIANSKPFQPSTRWSNQSKSTTTWTNQSKT